MTPPPAAVGDQPDTPAEPMAWAWWAWWVVRDDGDRCAGPFDTRDEADRKLRTLFDPGEYQVDYQYTPPTPPAPARPAPARRTPT